LLDGCLKPLNQPNDTNWLNIVPTLDNIFEELEPSVKDELVHQLCLKLNIDVDYDKNILLLKRFFADIDHDGVCINNNISRHMFKLLSLIYNAYDIVWAKDAKATFAKSKEIKRQFDAMKQSMPADSTPAEVMKEVNKLIFKNAKAASLSTDEPVIVSDDVIMTTNDDESSSHPSSTDEPVIVGDYVIMTTNDDETPKPMRALLCRMYQRNVLWSLGGYGKYLTAKIAMVGSFAVCTGVQTAVLTSAHKNGVGSRPNYSMLVKMMVQETLGVDTIFIDIFPGTHNCKALDKRMPTDLACQGAECATDIVNVGLAVIAFGGLAQEALRNAVMQTKATIKITNVPHPCQTSAFKCTNDVAVGFAKRYHVHFPSDVGSFEGFVYGHGLNPDTADFGVGGVLGVIFCKRHLEKVSGKMCENVHISASSFCFGLGIQNDIQAAAYLTSFGFGHHPVPSCTLLYIILHAIKGGTKGGSCGGLNDYRVVEAQTELDILLDATAVDKVAIKAARKKLEDAIELRDITSKAKSKSGSCGGLNDPRVVKAQAKVEKLLDATVIDKDAIKAAMKELVAAVAKKENTREGKSDGGKYIHSKRSYSLFHSQQQFLTMSICCDFIISCTKGKTKAEESFDVLNGCFLQSERKGADFKVRLQ